MPPLVIIGIEHNITKKGKVSNLVVASPLGATYRVHLCESVAVRLGIMLANERKLLAAAGLASELNEAAEVDDDMPDVERFSRN